MAAGAHANSMHATPDTHHSFRTIHSLRRTSVDPGDQAAGMDSRGSPAYTADMSTQIRPSKHTFVYDCADPAALAGFYAEILGWNVSPDSDEQWVDLVAPEGSAFGLSFQRVDDYVAPTWPEGPVPQQAHLDFDVPSIEEAAQVVEAAGATRHPVQPSETGSFAVFADPAGHLFCLCAE